MIGFDQQVITELQLKDHKSGISHIHEINQILFKSSSIQLSASGWCWFVLPHIAGEFAVGVRFPQQLVLCDRRRVAYRIVPLPIIDIKPSTVYHTIKRIPVLYSTHDTLAGVTSVCCTN